MPHLVVNPVQLIKQQGFTLIELVIVIVLLGILTAIALPKFASLQTDARTASIEAASGAIKSAMAIVHAQSLVEGEESSSLASVILQGTAITTIYGYPSSTDINQAAGIGSSDYSISSNGINRNIRLNNSIQCQVRYRQAVNNNTVPVITINTNGC
ncbi:MAG: type II secretion system protein [Methylophagaceae bacterium]